MMKIGKFDYSKLNTEEPVKIPLYGRSIKTAQKTVLTYARRKGIIVTTKIVDDELYAIVVG